MSLTLFACGASGGLGRYGGLGRWLQSRVSVIANSITKDLAGQR